MFICFGKYQLRTASSNIFKIIVVCAAIAVHSASAQSTPTVASPVVSQANQAFSAGKLINSIEMSGNAIVHEGGAPDEGEAVLTANVKGQAELRLNLRKGGERVESQDSSSAAMTCTWKRSDGLEHKARGMHCQKSLVWFVPMITMQDSGQSSQSVSSTDLGVNNAVPGVAPHRALAVQFLNPKGNDSNSPTTATRPHTKPVKLELDSNSFLPTSLKFSLPAQNTSASLAFEIRFSDYRKVGEAQLPYLIQRYVNGALQLEIHVAEAHITN